MGADERLVAVISPWEKLSDLVKRQFRVESLPAEKKVMVWRDDLQTKEKLTKELEKLGIHAPDVRTKKITQWRNVD